jgi:hypothetical protein
MELMLRSSFESSGGSSFVRMLMQVAAMHEQM